MTSVGGDPGRPRRGPGAVVVLGSVLAVLLLIWVVGSFLLVRFADELPAAPRPSPTTSSR